MTTQGATAILVAGMHRSGTSALAGALGMVGISLGEELLAPGSDNPKGYWEHQGVVEIHERLLAALDRRWDDVRPLPTGWLGSDAAMAASAEISKMILRDFAESPVWAVKDPRICRLLPLWTDVLQQLRIKPVVLFAARKPSEVAASIEARNHWATPVGEMLWLRHVLEAETASRSLPRTAVIYDDLLSDPSAAISSAMATLGVPIPVPTSAKREALVQFVDRADRHHAHAAAAGGSTMGALAEEAYAALVEIAHDGSAWNRLQDCAIRFDEEWRRYGSSIEAVAAMAHRFHADEMSARIEAVELSSKLNAQVRWSEEAVEIRSALQARYDQQSTDLQAVSAELASANERNADLLAECERLLVESEKQRIEAESLDAMVKAIHQSRSWRVTKPLRALAQWFNSKPGKA